MSLWFNSLYSYLILFVAHFQPQISGSTAPQVEIYKDTDLFSPAVSGVPTKVTILHQEKDLPFVPPKHRPRLRQIEKGGELYWIMLD